jgi:hypothetical protein
MGHPNDVRMGTPDHRMLTLLYLITTIAVGAVVVLVVEIRVNTPVDGVIL